MKIVQLVIMVLAAIFVMSAFSVDARLNHQLVLKAMGINTVSSHRGGEKSYDNAEEICRCNYKYPPDCWCPKEGQVCDDTCARVCRDYPPPFCCPTCRCGDNPKDYCANDVAEKPDKEKQIE